MKEKDSKSLFSVVVLKDRINDNVNANIAPSLALSPSLPCPPLSLSISHFKKKPLNSIVHTTCNNGHGSENEMCWAEGICICFFFLGEHMNKESRTVQ